MKNWHKLVFIILVLASCKEKKELPAASMYHWKTTFTMTAADSLKLDSLGVERLYIRFFDVDTELERIVPKGVIEWKTLPPADLVVVPCVFITNRCMQYAPDTSIQSLAALIYSKIARLKKDLKNPVPEIQIDCDWTEDTRDKYFRLLEDIRKLCLSEHLMLSATIRLHQVKYPEKTGVPPVDKGMLMFYNMGKLKDIAESNSILNLNTAKAYLQNIDSYPLELDVALPLFSWSLQFRDGKMKELHSSWNRSDIESDTLFSKLYDNWFKAREDGVFKKVFVQKNDRIRVEESTPQMDLEAIALLCEHMKKDPKFLSLFHYNPHEIDQYSVNAVKEIYNVWD